ncbi:MAG: hypothetical protein WCP79_11705 [Bacillota bacterium]
MPIAWALGGSALLGFLGSQNQASAARSAADLQAQAAQRAQDQQMQMFTTLNEQQKPYREAGYGALGKIGEMLPQFTKTFTAADLNANLAPNYEFMRQQGLGATGQAANVASPGSNVDLAKTMFAENYAKNSYQDALNNWRNQQTDIFNRLSGIAGIGQTAQGSAQALGSQTAANIGQLGIGGASATGAGMINAANAQAGGLQGFGNAATMYSLLNPSGASNVSGSNFMKQYNAIGA